MPILGLDYKRLSESGTREERASVEGRDERARRWRGGARSRRHTAKPRYSTRRFCQLGVRPGRNTSKIPQTHLPLFVSCKCHASL